MLSIMWPHMDPHPYTHLCLDAPLSRRSATVPLLALRSVEPHFGGSRGRLPVGAALHLTLPEASLGAAPKAGGGGFSGFGGTGQDVGDGSARLQIPPHLYYLSAGAEIYIHV